MNYNQLVSWAIDTGRVGVRERADVVRRAYFDEEGTLRDLMATEPTREDHPMPLPWLRMWQRIQVGRDAWDIAGDPPHVQAPNKPEGGSVLDFNSRATDIHPRIARIRRMFSRGR